MHMKLLKNIEGIRFKLRAVKERETDIENVKLRPVLMSRILFCPITLLTAILVKNSKL